MADMSGRKARRQMGVLGQLLVSVLNELESYNQSNYVIPSVFSNDAPPVLDGIKRCLDRIMQCIEHRPAPFQHTFSDLEAPGIIDIIRRSKEALERLQNCIMSIPNLRFYDRVIREGHLLLDELHDHEGEFQQFHDELDRYYVLC